tara:strand:- start:538 stop:1071 length:534 start_codon:yes stop_codon:yes gene_type:complete
MKRVTITSFLVFFSLLIFSQARKTDSTLIGNDFFHNQQTSLALLSGWSVANLSISPLSSENLFKPKNNLDYFHQMNFFFNVINGAIAGFAHYEVNRRSKLSWSYLEIEEQRQKALKSIKINMGLDISYILLGLGLKNVVDKVDQKYPQYTGYGNSLILQGAYLLLYDAIFLKKIRKR